MNARLTLLALVLAPAALASSPDPQVKTDHPYYPGELSCSTFDRLFQTESDLYRRTTGRSTDSDEDKALAAWYWRNVHYFHADAAGCNAPPKSKAAADPPRDYWTGLFAYGFGLCGTTHAQWTAEFDRLLGHCRSRVVGTTGHNSFEVFLTGGAYGQGRWALLDHDLSTVVYSADGSRLLSLAEVMADLHSVRTPPLNRPAQHGWRIAGLADEDPAAYTSFHTVEYLAGYAGPPPVVHLRAGETLRRYTNPGLEDGRTFVFWGYNFNDQVPGPQRSRTWVNQPEKMYNSKDGTGSRAGQARYGNAVYTYTPNFSDGSYKEAVVAESESQVTFGFASPYVIGATPANAKPWGIYDQGGRNGLVVTMQTPIEIEVSIDGGQTWHKAGTSPDLTDLVKGQSQYLLRFRAGAEQLKNAALAWRTVCQCNPAIIPHLKDDGTRVTFHSSGQAIGAPACVWKDKPAREAGLSISTPNGQTPTRLYAESWNASGNPPDPKEAYSIEYSPDDGKTWQPAVSDWRIVRRTPEPNDFWSQSFTWAETPLPPGTPPTVQVRFTNTGRKPYRQFQASLAYAPAQVHPTRVTFAWTEGGDVQTATHTYPPAAGREDSSWSIPTGKAVQTAWVEYAPG